MPPIIVITLITCNFKNRPCQCFKITRETAIDSEDTGDFYLLKFISTILQYPDYIKHFQSQCSLFSFNPSSFPFYFLTIQLELTHTKIFESSIDHFQNSVSETDIQTFKSIEKISTMVYNLLSQAFFAKTIIVY